jgi:DNA-binding GntR family transcriptional regulator
MLMGDLPLGSRLSELGLAREIGISRTPIREALNRLGTEGFLEQVPHYGTFVKELRRENVQELYELREMLEGYAAERAATRLTRDQLDELQRLCDVLHQMCRQLRDNKGMELPPNQQKQWVLADVAFHLLVLQAADSPRTNKIVADLRLLTNLCGHQLINPEKYQLQWRCWTWSDHLRMVRAFRKKDGAAARFYMSHHIRGAMKGMLENYHPEDPRLPDYDLPESIRRTIREMELLMNGKNP